MSIIKKIIEKRKEKIIFIQKIFHQFLKRKQLILFAKKLKEYYSIYPSREDFNEISIKLYTNLKDPAKFAELPVRKCDKRNYYIFDIPKAKFPSKKKFMCFTFILDGSTIVDSKYKCIYFGGKYVNQIDFNCIDKKEIKLQKAFKSYMFLYKKILFKNENNTNKNKIIDISKNNENNSQSKKVFNLSNDIEKYLNEKNSKSVFCSLNNSRDFKKIYKSIKEGRGSSKKKKRNKSILKEHKDKKIKTHHTSKSLDKKVSFGWVEKSE